MSIRVSSHNTLALALVACAVACSGDTRLNDDAGGDTGGSSDEGIGDIGGDDDDDDSTSDEFTIGDDDDDDDDSEESGSTDTGDICGEVQVALTVPPPNVMMVLDKSGSMVKYTWDHDGDSATAEVTRWSSLVSVVDTLTQTFNDTINFGAQLFPSKLATATLDPMACVTESMPEVPVGASNRTNIMAAIPDGDAGASEIAGATPATAGVASAANHLRGHTGPGAIAIILVTDGAANCNVESEACTADPSSDDCRRDLFNTYDDRLAPTVGEIFQTDGIPVYVVGVAIEHRQEMGIDPVVKLNEVAELGGVPNEDPEHKFYSASNQIELESAMRQIAGEVQSCIVRLDEAPNTPPEADQVRYVKFKIDGVEVPKAEGTPTSCDGVSGWRWLDPRGPYTAVEMCGEWCEMLKVSGELDGTYGCPPPP